MRNSQLSMFDSVSLEFGGSLLKGNPKSRRPLDSKWPIFLTLRAAESGMRAPKAYGEIRSLVFGIAKKHGVRIYGFSNVGNHLHLIIRVGRLHRWNPFIRETTSKIAKFMGTKNFWLYRPHTRIVKSWKTGFQRLKDYIYLNELEGQGFINRKETRSLADLRALLSS